MPRFLCYLRIAFSAACLIACVLLIALWVRSYQRFDVLAYIRYDNAVGNSSERGSLSPFFESDSNHNWKPVAGRWYFHSEIIDSFARQMPHVILSWEEFLWDYHPPSNCVPHWTLVVVLVTLSAVPWIPRQFGLRTLLIATTLIAVLLGLIVWAVRR